MDVKLILHPTDRSENALKALAFACELAAEKKAQLLVLHVQRRHGSERIPPEMEEFARLEGVRETEAVSTSRNRSCRRYDRGARRAKYWTGIVSQHERRRPQSRFPRPRTSWGAVVTALLDHLVQKGVLTVPEVHDILTATHRDIGHRGQSVAGLHADHLISALVRHFSEGI